MKDLADVLREAIAASHRSGKAYKCIFSTVRKIVHARKIFKTIPRVKIPKSHCGMIGIIGKKKPYGVSEVRLIY